MCRNHSHLVASLIAEDTGGAIPVLIHHLQHSPLTVEMPGGSRLILPTSGLLYVPSLSLGGSLQFPLPAMEARSMSLFYMPDAALTGILDTVWRLMSSSPPSTTRPAFTARSRTEAMEDALEQVARVEDFDDARW